MEELCTHVNSTNKYVNASFYAIPSAKEIYIAKLLMVAFDLTIFDLNFTQSGATCAAPIYVPTFYSSLNRPPLTFSLFPASLFLRRRRLLFQIQPNNFNKKSTKQAILFLWLSQEQEG